MWHSWLLMAVAHRQQSHMYACSCIRSSRWFSAARFHFSLFPKGGRSRANASNVKMAHRKRNTILEDFIGIYKSEPCLWRVKCKDYHDRDKRAAAYEKLLTKFKELAPTATKDDVLRKINTFRCNIRRERKKQHDSMRSAALSRGIYQTKLWYFHLFDFIDDQDVPRSALSDISYEEENDSNDTNPCTENNTDSTDTTYNTTADTTENVTITTQKKAQVDVTKPEKKQTEQEQLTNDVLLSMKDHFMRLAPNSAPEDRYDLLGRSIAIKLRSIEKRQRLIAEKIINDTLFDAEMENLSTKSFRSPRN